MARVVARIRLPLMGAALVLLVASWFGPAPVFPAAMVVLLVALAGYFLVGRARGEPVEITAPVRGRWVAVNSPSSRVPSHGLHAWGQSYAVDLVHVPRGPYAPRLRWSNGFRPPDEFPGFGRPVLAPVAGRVVRARDRERDHRSRSSWPAMLLLLVESAVREVRGPAGLLGNHLVIDAGDHHVVLAHLRRGSLRVGRGDRVDVGRQVAECGNSGNSTEPHVHVQVQDVAVTGLAAGLPMRFAASDVEDVVPRYPGIPPNGHALVATDGSPYDPGA